MNVWLEATPPSLRSSVSRVLARCLQGVSPATGSRCSGVCPAMGTIRGMTVPTEAKSTVTGISVLLYSDDRATRDAVRLGVGQRPAEGVMVESWHECATADGVMLALEEETFDVLILDGEATPYGGLGVCRQIKNEIFDCPPIMVLIGRPDDGWLAAWSQADAVVPHPLDPAALAQGVAGLVAR